MSPQSGSYSEKIGMAGIMAVAIITLVAVVGMIGLLYVGKALSTELAMIATGGLAIIGTALKTSPDETKQRNPGVQTERIETVNVGAPPEVPQPPIEARRGPENGP